MAKFKRKMYKYIRTFILTRMKSVIVVKNMQILWQFSIPKRIKGNIGVEWRDVKIFQIAYRYKIPNR